MKKILGIFFVSVFIISIILSTFESVTSSFAVKNSADRYSASSSPVKIADKGKVDFAKNR